jgi:hypothetical protein
MFRQVPPSGKEMTVCINNDYDYEPHRSQNFANYALKPIQYGLRVLCKTLISAPLSVTTQKLARSFLVSASFEIGSVSKNKNKILVALSL